MKTTKKVIIIIIIIVLCILIGLPFLFSGFLLMHQFNKEQDRNELENKARQISTLYLEEKYPDRQFDIKHIEVDAYCNGFAFRGWNNRVNVTIEEYAEEYKMCVYTSDTEKLGKPVCFDTVETEIIKDAIVKKINEIVNFNSETIEYNFIFDYHPDEWFNQKFDGDITSFLENENAQRRLFNEYELNINLYCSYLNGTEQFFIDEDDKKFLQMLDTLILINFTNESPKPFDDGYLFYTFESVEGIKSSILDKGISLNSLYAYNKENNQFENF